MKSRVLLLFLTALHIISAVSLRAASDYTTPYVFTTFAGTSSIGSQDGTGAAARFYSPYDVTTDSKGNLFVVDEGNHTIRRITPTGIVTTFAGSPGIPGSDDGKGSVARFDSPQCIVADSSDNLFVTDTGNHTVRKITPAGIVTTIAGLAKITGNTDGNGRAARFNLPRGIAIDSNENLYVTETGYRPIRKITPNGEVTSNLNYFSFPEHFNGAYGAITADTVGNLYVSGHDSTTTYTQSMTANNYFNYYVGHIFRISQQDTVDRLWQTVIYEYLRGSIFNHSVYDLEVIAPGKLLLMSSQQISHHPGDSFMVGSGDIGSTDGSASEARFGSSSRLTQDANGTIYVADTGNNNIRKVSTDGSVTTLAGLALDSAAGTLDESGAAARFKQPHGIAIDAVGNVFVTDSTDNCIRRIAPNGTVTTLAGKTGFTGSTDGTGSAALFNQPKGLAIDASGNLFVADSGNHTIRRVTPSGEVSTFAGSPDDQGYDDGTSNEARFFYPKDVAIDTTGNLYVINLAQTVRKITPTGETSTLAGSPRDSGYIDGQGADARFVSPQGLAVDVDGNVFVSEGPYSPDIARIRKISPTGQVTTLAGAEQGSADGIFTEARFYGARGLTVDADGNLFIADSYNQTIRKISQSQNNVATVAGVADAPGSSDGTGREARFYYPKDVAVDSLGNIYVTSGTTVRKGVIATGPVITTQPTNHSVASGANASFSVTASGLPAPTYQWQFNGNAINGSTGSTLSLTNARTTDAGDYTVVVTNPLGSVTSDVARLTVNSNSTTSRPPSSSSSGGGGGAPSTWFLGAITALAFARWLARRRAQNLCLSVFSRG